MSKTNVNKKVYNNVQNISDCKQTGWNEALQDAERQLEAAENEVAQWKATVRICRERVRTGAPWPDEKAGTTA